MIVKATNVKVKKTHPDATFEQANPEAAGYDLTCVGIENKGNGLISLDLGIQTEIPDDYYFQLVPRSSFTKSGFVMPNSPGTIDPDYRGNWQMRVRYVPKIRIAEKEVENCEFIIETKTEFNNGDEEFQKLKGAKVAQAILRKKENAFVEFVEELNSTERGSGGFGSTGK